MFAKILLVFALLWGCAFASAQGNQFVEIHEGEHWIWFCRDDIYSAHKQAISAMFSYADKAFNTLEAAWGLKPKQEKYFLLVQSQTGGGFAAGDISEIHMVTGKPSPGIGLAYDSFFNDAHGVSGYWAVAIMTHEMVNMFTGAIVSGGWPVNWWADDISPFPYFTSIQIEFKLAPMVGVSHLEDAKNDKLIQMFTALKDQFGWEMYRRAFQAAIDDGISWPLVGKNPSPELTNYVAAYLELGARRNISSYMKGIVPNYDHVVVEAILQAHIRWHAHQEDSEAFKVAKDQFLHGKYADVK